MEGGGGVSGILIGCSGWSYDDWKGVFYPTTVRSMLQEYVKIFPTAEINASFYRVPDQGTVHGWARYTPPGFEFAAKVPQTVTHDRKLVGAEKDLKEFLTVMQPLKDAGKLGPLLIQLPPSLRFDKARVKEFLSILPKGYKFALEPREPSWMAKEAVELLRDANVCLVAVDEPLLPPEVHITADFAYFRWHGHGEKPWYNYEYSKEELEPWVPRIAKALQEVPRAYGFFNNHYHGFGPKNALELTEMLDKLTAEQRQKLATLSRGGEGGKRAENLDAYVPKEGAVAKEVGVMMTKISDQGRIDRAKEIPPRDLALSKVDANFVRGDVHGTRVVLDLAEQEVRHNCPDYLRGIKEKRVCKHIVRLLLALPPEIAREFVDDLAKSKADWKFEEYWRGDSPQA
jgi:uncharacterized protein YecE (DUF72 family)